MKKISKICSLLLMVPVLGAGSLLAGCSKDEATMDQIIKEYNAMVKSTQTDDYVNSSSNQIFTYTNVANPLGGENYDYLQVSNELNGFVNFDINLKEYLGLDVEPLDEEGNKTGEPTLQEQFETEMKAKYPQKTDDASTEKVDESESDEAYAERIQGYLNEYDLYDLYNQLDVLYGKLLLASNDYFYTYQKGNNGLFSTDVKISGKELKTLLTKTKKLRKAVDSFYSNLKDRQELAEFLGSTTQVMTSKLKTFNSVYVNLINANFEFNIAFCNLHNKYVLKDNNFFHETAERLAREAALKYAYGYFLDNVKPYQHNNLCDTTGLLNIDKDKTFNLYDELFKNLFADVHVKADETDDETDITPNGTYYGKGYLGVLTATTTDGDAWKFRGVENEGTNAEGIELYQTLQTRIKALKQQVDRFDIFLDLYKDNVADFDMYSYNELRTGDADSTLYASEEDFRASLNAEQTAKLEVIDNFTSYDLPALLNALNDVLVGTGYTAN